MLDPAELDLPSYHPVKSAREHQLDRLAVFRAQAEAGGEPIEPMLRISLEFLENNIPDYDGPVVLVQGDTGPGNLMYQDGRVTGIIDWELAHLSDPMDDIAWLCWRTVQHTFTDFAERLREYQALSGHQIDVDRVNYYRVNAFVVLCAASSSQAGAFGLPSMAEPSADSGAARSASAESERGADGSAFAMTTAAPPHAPHRLGGCLGHRTAAAAGARRSRAAPRVLKLRRSARSNAPDRA